jgi:TRAP transporter TAXI family solute receptor
MLSTLKKDVYDAVADVQTLVVPNLVVAHKDMPDDAAYLLTKTIFEHLDELHAVHAAAKDTKLDTAALYKGAPYHPGAIRFYKEAKVWPGG